MERELWVEEAALRRVIKEAAAGRSTVNQSLQNMEQICRHLDRVWEGNAKTAYVSRLKGLLRQLAAGQQGLLQLEADLAEAVTVYETCQQRALEKIKEGYSWV